jgi:probable HAF family extracellular repeat protein
MRRFSVRSGGLAALIGCATATAATPPLPSYGVTLIAVPSGAATVSATAINSSGQVTGAIGFTGGVPSQAFLYSAGSLSNLGSLNYPGTQLVGNTSGQAISAPGIVVGTFVDPVSQSWSFGFEYSGGVLTALSGASGFTNCTAVGINATGLIVGSCANSSSTEAVIYSGGAPQPIGPAGATASAVNDYGQVAGFTAAAGFVSNVNGGATVTIPALMSSAAAQPASPTAINNAGQVVGWQAEGTTYAAFLYSNGTNALLADVPASTVQPSLAINDAGQIVGDAQAVGSATATAYYIADGTLSDLDTLISRSDPNQPYVTFTNAYAISDNGWIVAGGLDSRTGLSGAYLLTPTTAFPTSVTVVAGATAVTGTPFTVGWTDQSATACTASGGSGSDGWKGGVAVNGGQQQVSETTAGTYEFTVSCSSTSSLVSSTAKVVVSNKSTPGLGGGGGGTLDVRTLAALLALCALRVLSGRRPSTA